MLRKMVGEDDAHGREAIESVDFDRAGEFGGAAFVALKRRIARSLSE